MHILLAHKNRLINTLDLPVYPEVDYKELSYSPQGARLA